MSFCCAVTPKPPCQQTIEVVRVRSLSENDAFAVVDDELHIAHLGLKAVLRRTFLDLEFDELHVPQSKLCWADDCWSDATTSVPLSDSDGESADRWRSWTSTDNELRSDPSIAGSSPSKPPGVFVQPELVATVQCKEPRARRSKRRSCPWVAAQTGTAEVLVGEHLEERGTGPDHGRTSLLLKNLPFDCNTSKLADMLDEQGLKGVYNFIYVPVDLRTSAAFGYAFVNTGLPKQAQDMMAQLDNFSGWTSSPEAPALAVQWSEPVQGLAAQIARYQNSPVMHDSIPPELRPQLFREGVPEAFPSPTKVVKAPRSRRSPPP